MISSTLQINLSLAIYSSAMIFFMLITSFRQSDNSINDRNHIYLRALLVTSLITLYIDLLSRLDGISGTSHIVCSISNFILFLLSPILVMLWYLYVCNLTGENKSEIRHGMSFNLILALINTLFVAFTPSRKLVYYFTNDLHYHRGSFYVVTSFIMVLMIIYLEVRLIIRHKSMSRQHFIALVFFPVIPIAASFIQVLFYGVAFAINATIFSLVVIMFYLQNRNLDVDYLTGVFNRRKFDVMLNKRIENSTSKESFSAILVDIDRFKEINDTFGHNLGDEALVDAAYIMRSCLLKDTFIARYGGDEFCIILDNSDKEQLKDIINRIHRKSQQFNRECGRPYNLYFSLGGDVYDFNTHMKAEEFVSHLDSLMYEQKHSVSKKPIVSENMDSQLAV